MGTKRNNMQFCYLIFVCWTICTSCILAWPQPICAVVVLDMRVKNEENKLISTASVRLSNFVLDKWTNSALNFTPPVPPFTNINAWISNNVVILSLLKVPYETRRWNKRSYGRYRVNSKRDVLKRKRTNLQT